MYKMETANLNTIVYGEMGEPNQKVKMNPSLDGDSVPAPRRASIRCLMAIYFVSGACSLIDEVIWVRLLKLTLGNTIYASSIVVSTFMGGLALGAFIMSRYSDGIRKRLRLYAVLEILITLSALSLPFGLKFADRVYIWFFQTYQPTSGELLLVQVMISGLLLLVPSMLMGSTLPLLGRVVTSLEKETGRLVGRLYALNTLGAALGCFMAGFVLIRLFGVMGTLYVAAVLNLFVAFGGWLLSRSSESMEEESSKAPVENLQAVPTGFRRGGEHVLLFALFMSGLISIGYELLWMRSIVHLLSGYTYVFSSVLTIYLLGNVIGAGIGSGLVKSLKNPAAGFAVTLSLLGVCGIFYLPVLIHWTSHALPHIDREVELMSMTIPFSTYMIKPLVQSAFLFLLPSVMMGVGFPIALQAWARRTHQVGRTTGMAYSVNTVGAVVGGLTICFVFIPWLGLQMTMFILALAGMWMGGILWLLFAGGNKIVGRTSLLGVASISTLIVLALPPNLFETVVKSNPKLPEQLELIAAEEGVATTVSLYRDPREETLYLYTSGQRVAGDTYFWRSDQKMLGHFGILLNRGAKSVLSVGFGSGESTACMALHQLERADCVEIAPEIVNLSSRYFEHINLGDKLNNEIGMIFMDAKNYIHLTDVMYDSIVNDSIHPKHFAENASLYATEYFEDAAEHLNENGLFISWIPTHNVEPVNVIDSIIGTMMDVFEYVTVWYMTTDPAQYFLVVGSKEPQFFSPGHMEAELSKEGVRDSLSEINIYNSMDVISCYIGDQDDLERVIGSYPFNSDMRPYIEFTTADQPGGCTMFRRFVSSVRSDSVYQHIDWEGFNREQKNKWLKEYARLHTASTYLLMSNGAATLLDKLSCCMEGLTILPGNPALQNLKSRTEKEIFSFCADLILSDRADAALVQAEKMLDIHPHSAVAWMIKSLSLQKKGNVKEGLDAAATAIKLEPDIAEAHFILGSLLSGSGHLDEAAAAYDEIISHFSHSGK